MPALHLPVLEAGPFVLRPFVYSDATAVLEATADPLIPLITTVPDIYDLGAVEAYIERQRRRAPSGQGYSWAIAERDDGRLVGHAGLWPLREDPTRATAGYWILASQRRKGAARCALGALTRWGLAELGLSCIELSIEAINAGSIRTAQSVGFTRIVGEVRWEQIGPDLRALDVYACSDVTSLVATE